MEPHGAVQEQMNLEIILLALKKIASQYVQSTTALQDTKKLFLKTLVIR
jgi:hypothetical protein